MGKMKRLVSQIGLLLFLLVAATSVCSGIEADIVRSWSNSLSNLTMAARDRVTKDSPAPYLSMAELESHLIDLPKQNEASVALKTIKNAYRQAALTARDDYARYSLINQFELELKLLADKLTDKYDNGSSPLSAVEVRVRLDDLLLRLFPKTKDEKPVKAGPGLPVAVRWVRGRSDTTCDIGVTVSGDG